MVSQLFEEMVEYISSACFYSMQKPAPKKHVVHHIAHIKQEYDWDCGLACILMALNAAGISDCNENMLDSLCEIQSIWTIDLAYLLRLSGAVVVFATVRIGANPDFAAVDYYVGGLVNDGARVNCLFDKAHASGIPILLRSFSANKLMGLMLSGLCIVIVLIDMKKLYGASALRPSLPPSQESLLADESYVGHYIVVCGYETNRDEFFIQDPGFDNNSGYWIQTSILDQARISFGTDEDLLIVALDKNIAVDKLLEIIEE